MKVGALAEKFIEKKRKVWRGVDNLIFDFVMME